MLGHIHVDPHVPVGRVFIGFDRRPAFAAPLWTITVHPQTLDERASELPAWIKDAERLALAQTDDARRAA